MVVFPPDPFQQAVRAWEAPRDGSSVCVVQATGNTSVSTEGKVTGAAEGPESQGRGFTVTHSLWYQ